MSADLTKSRQQMSQIRTLLKQGKTQPAVQALYATLVTILKTPLMKSERDEFDKMLDEAVYVVSTDAEIKKIYPVQIAYVKGNERELLEVLRELLNTFDSTILDSAQEAVRIQEERKRKILLEAEELHGKGEEVKARELLNRAAREFKDDPAYIGEIGELCIKLGMYDEAIAFLENALELKPDLVYLYNKIGMVLRKVKNFSTAEKYYLKASEYLINDPNLFFNLGRVYLDWEKWRKAVLAASGALKLDPNFHEAKKLQIYAQKKLDEQV